MMTTPQMPSLQGTPEQQSSATVQAWPTSAHSFGTPQVPLVAPGSRIQDPVQQSAVVVHTPSSFEQPPPQVRGGNSPVPLGVQGRPQQSALVAQSSPSNIDGSAQSISAITQRGMPRLSCLQVSFCRTLPAQQLAFSLQDWLCSRQMPPAGVQELPASQRPMGLPSTFEQVTLALSPSGVPSAPQQSLSSRQSSPVG